MLPGILNIIQGSKKCSTSLSLQVSKTCNCGLSAQKQTITSWKQTSYLSCTFLYRNPYQAWRCFLARSLEIENASKWIRLLLSWPPAVSSSELYSSLTQLYPSFCQWRNCYLCHCHSPKVRLGACWQPRANGCNWQTDEGECHAEGQTSGDEWGDAEFEEKYSSRCWDSFVLESTTKCICKLLVSWWAHTMKSSVMITYFIFLLGICESLALELQTGKALSSFPKVGSRTDNLKMLRTCLLFQSSPYFATDTEQNVIKQWRAASSLTYT